MIRFLLILILVFITFHLGFFQIKPTSSRGSSWRLCVRFKSGSRLRTLKHIPAVVAQSSLNAFIALGKDVTKAVPLFYNNGEVSTVHYSKLFYSKKS